MRLPIVAHDLRDPRLTPSHAFVGGWIVPNAHVAIARHLRELLDGQGAAVEGDRRGHDASLSSFCSALTSSARGTVNCPGRAASHSRRSPTALVFSRPTAMSLIVTIPSLFSFEP